MSNRRFQIALHCAAATGLAVVASPAPAQPSQDLRYDLPAQELARSLREVSLRSGVAVIAPADLLAGRQAPALQGLYTAREAAEALLLGTGLGVDQVGEALVVRRMTSGRVPDAAAPRAETGSADIVVTGTNLRGAEPASPVILLTRRDIDASGATSVEQLVGKLPQNAQHGVNRENFRAPGAGADVTEHGSGLNLRGLGQRATLVLINGRRVAPSNTGGFVDVSLIPLSAIERVEIVTDGASAIYGSDAVGGVVNFILRRGFEGVEALATVGTATSGDGDLRQAGATAGAAWDGGGAMLSYEYRAEDPILARDRDFTVNIAPGTFLLPRERRHSLLGSLGHELSPSLQLDVTASYAERSTDRSYFFAGSLIPVDAAAEARSIGLSGGLRYAFAAGWGAELSGGYSVTSTDQEQLQGGPQGLVNGRSTRNAISDVRLKVDGSLLDLPAGPVRVALGAETRHESYQDRFRTQSISVPTDISRNVAAAFFETQVPLFSSLNRRPGFERLLVTAAARFEHYDGFGSTFDPKVGLLWSPLPGLTLRTSYDTSFRAPLLSEAAGTYTATYAPASLLYIDPDEAEGVGLLLSGFDPAVRPERSTSWTIGGEFEPIAGLVISLNHYAIRFSNRIARPTPIITVVGDPAFESIVTRDPDDAFVASLIADAITISDFSGPGFSNGNATPADVMVIVDTRATNTALTTTSGLDANLRLRLPFGRNEFLLQANANYVLSFEDRLRPLSPSIETVDTVYGPLNLRLRGQAGWRRGGWSANLFVNHADDYRDTRGNRSLRVGSFTTLDAGAAYEFQGDSAPGWLRGTRVALHAENLLDEAPPRLLPDTFSTSGLGYDPVNASGRGRFVSIQVRKTW